MKRLRSQEFFLLLAWCGLGLALRLLNLGGQPVWADEWTTFVFSLGHSFRDLPLNQLLTLEALLQPVRLDEATAWEGVQHLMNESTHPPLYFWLSHHWIQLWQQSGELISPWVGRSLSVLFSTLTILATYGLGLCCGAARRTAHVATALTAVSPFGIYLAQEARHYTLAMLWGMAALGCFVRAWQSLSHPSLDRPIHWPLWIGVNALGFATHYVFALFLAAQGLAMAGSWLVELWYKLRAGMSWPVAIAQLNTHPWRQVAIAALGSALGILPWAWFLGRASGNDLTAWIEQDLSGWGLLAPLGRLLSWLISMVMVLPVEQVPVGVAIASGLGLVVMLVWLLPQLLRGGRQVLQAPVQTAADRAERVSFQALMVLFGAQVAVVLGLTYGLNRDLTLSPRYGFALLPEVLLAIAIALGALWPRSRRLAIVLVLLGCLGSGTVAFGLAYQKADRPDQLVAQIQDFYQSWRTQAGDVWPGDPLAQQRPRSLVMAIIQKTHSETGKLLGVAQEWHERSESGLQTPGFVLLRRNPDTYAATRGIRDATATVARPFDLWLINFSASGNFRDLGCTLEPDVVKLRSPGYSARRFVCN
ncbi:MAG: hypothetical protein HC857_17480 [Synechococcales cyanobacterium RU_4_20]|nr:hypothetical protein [Synechococcales cyanobacterium RU_4_20]NJR70200.1 hypothetical protein [Synechococcales cyanobacterium CRU_2_2]